MRIVHVSDIHFWKLTFNPLRVLNKRLVGMTSLLLGRARRFRLAHVPEVVERVCSLEPDHILITGDLTTTSLPAEFQEARTALSAWLGDPARVTAVPGNHDRYTPAAVRNRLFERYFGTFAPEGEYPWLRTIGHRTAILGLDPTRAGITASGILPRAQLIRAQELLDLNAARISRLIIACHYPVAVPPPYRREWERKPLRNADEVRRWLGTIGRHLYCCGHVHATWAFRPHEIPDQLCLNPGAPLLRDPKGHRPPGFLEIVLEGRDVTVSHHAFIEGSWQVRRIEHADGFFPGGTDD